jgi:glycosyltransferase involved in cell wall biosynthesis
VAPKVSIITTTYNHELYIGSCVESVLEQTDPDWEQIILDDGSTDRTRQMVERYKDPRVRYVFQENQGIEALAANYNRALALASGDLIAILEGDDTWPADKLTTMVPVFENPEIVLAFGDARDLGENGSTFEARSRTGRSRARLPKSVFFNDPVRSATAHLLSHDGQAFIPPSTAMVRRQALASIGGFQQAPGASPVDVPTFARLSLVGKFHYIPKLLGYRRRHMKSATVQFLEGMTNTVRRYALEAAADPSMRLSAGERQSVEKSWQSVPFSAEFWLGRICLVNRQTKEARRHFAAAMGARDARLVLSSLLGWALSWLNSDMEGLARRMGMFTLSPDGKV